MNKISDILSLARELRNKETKAERLLWTELRRKKFWGHKFLRQHPILYNRKFNMADFFVADFYCAKLNLIVEVDGGIHLHQKDYDQGRDELLTELGYLVLRFTNEEVESNILAVLNTIESNINGVNFSLPTGREGVTI